MIRLLQFKNELMTLWRAFFAPETPVYLKGLMLLVPAYLLSPIDLVPDFIPIAGWLDDAIVIPLLVSLIVRMLPQPAMRTARARSNSTIDGDYRRL